MDMEEPSLMDVVHDTINSTRRSGSAGTELVVLLTLRQEKVPDPPEQVVESRSA